MLTKYLKLGNRGDTIVEVLIVLTVLGSAISASYYTANRSLISARQAQETSEAASIVQSQIELLRVMGPSSKVNNLGNPIDSTTYVFVPGPFCINVSTKKVVSLTGATLTDYANYPAACISKSLYHISITYVAATNTFTVKSIWDDPSGKGQDTVTLYTRVHKP